MTWKIKFLPGADKDLRKIDRTIAQRILKFLDEKISYLDDPRSVGEALKGPQLGKYWKYRVGNYRLICLIKDADVLILVISVGHRKNVYQS
ncbi:MAG: type II toxin-antitoxin system RelE/ParE family toxin [Acidobacteria bacterium]|nr:type II toxin-antitoxin system RelE/ParE family toxin [Acidobacteriota bacterium]MCG2814908.1 type II toxin-antitoxin system RelE/ParE family toxin [Candidatus Aminicenantes bacterium]